MESLAPRKEITAELGGPNPQRPTNSANPAQVRHDLQNETAWMYDPGDTPMAAASRFRGTIRYFRPELKSGLAVVDIPKTVATELGGLKQVRVRGKLNGADMNSNTMPAGGGVLALSLSQKLISAAGLKVGDEIDIELQRIDASR
jgi:hypothetical protein